MKPGSVGELAALFATTLVGGAVIGFVLGRAYPKQPVSQATTGPHPHHGGHHGHHGGGGHGWQGVYGGSQDYYGLPVVMAGSDWCVDPRTGQIVRCSPAQILAMGPTIGPASYFRKPDLQPASYFHPYKGKG